MRRDWGGERKKDDHGGFIENSDWSPTCKSVNSKNLSVPKVFTAAFAAHGKQTVSVNCTTVSIWKPRSSRKPVTFVEPGLYSRSKYFLSVAP